MHKYAMELMVGIFMILAALALAFLAIRVSGLSAQSLFGDKGYLVSAEFSDIGNLKIRAPVRIAGVEIGQVVEITLDPSNFQARVVMRLNQDINDIPSDSSASVTSAGILGDNYISLTPGYSSSNLQAGSEITTTYSATSLQSLISTFMSGAGKQSAPAQAQPQAQ